MPDMPRFQRYHQPDRQLRKEKPTGKKGTWTQHRNLQGVFKIFLLLQPSQLCFLLQNPMSSKGPLARVVLALLTS